MNADNALASSKAVRNDPPFSPTILASSRSPARAEAHPLCSIGVCCVDPHPSKSIFPGLWNPRSCPTLGATRAPSLLFTDAEALQPVKSGHLQSDAVVVVPMIGLHGDRGHASRREFAARQRTQQTGAGCRLAVRLRGVRMVMARAILSDFVGAAQSEKTTGHRLTRRPGTCRSHLFVLGLTMMDRGE
jgi:hypothetical protein